VILIFSNRFHLQNREKPEEKIPFGRPGHRLEDNIKMILEKC
jgi:hypothetical protein